MSHHSSNNSLTAIFGGSEENRKKLDDMMRMVERADKQQKMLDNELGPTGEFPNGRIVPHDEGGLMFGVTVFNGRVIFDFGKPVRSIGFTREGALELAELIRQRAQQCPAIFAPRKEPA